jgi:hypothetical protein
MTANSFRLTLFLIAACAGTACANGQNSLKVGCLPAQQMKAEQLFGLWAVRFSPAPAGLPERATMRLQRHAEFSESLAGTVSRALGSAAPTATAGHAAQAALAGDLDEGLLLLDESSDNVTITATWNGEMQPNSCGQVYQGRWRDTSPSAAPDAADVSFTLTRLP